MATYKECKTLKFPGSDIIYVITDDGKVAVSQGIENAGKVLGVGEDGSVTLIEELLKYTKQILNNEQKIQARTNIDAVGKTAIMVDATSGEKTLTFTMDNSNSEWRYVYASGITYLTLNTSGSFTNASEAYYSIVFFSGATSTMVIDNISAHWIGDDCVDGIFVPATTKTYDIGIWWNGIGWHAIVRGV